MALSFEKIIKHIPKGRDKKLAIFYLLRMCNMDNFKHEYYENTKIIKTLSEENFEILFESIKKINKNDIGKIYNFALDNLNLSDFFKLINRYIIENKMTYNSTRKIDFDLDTFKFLNKVIEEELHFKENKSLYFDFNFKSFEIFSSLISFKKNDLIDIKNHEIFFKNMNMIYEKDKIEYKKLFIFINSLYKNEDMFYNNMRNTIIKFRYQQLKYFSFFEKEDFPNFTKNKNGLPYIYIPEELQNYFFDLGKIFFYITNKELDAEKIKKIVDKNNESLLYFQEYYFSSGILYKKEKLSIENRKEIFKIFYENNLLIRGNSLKSFLEINNIDYQTEFSDYLDKTVEHFFDNNQNNLLTTGYVSDSNSFMFFNHFEKIFDYYIKEYDNFNNFVPYYFITSKRNIEQNLDVYIKKIEENKIPEHILKNIIENNKSDLLFYYLKNNFDFSKLDIDINNNVNYKKFLKKSFTDILFELTMENIKSLREKKLSTKDLKKQNYIFNKNSKKIIISKMNEKQKLLNIAFTKKSFNFSSDTIKC